MRVAGQRSQSLVEFALLAPFLLFVIFGTLDFGRAFYAWSTINEAAAEGGRAAIKYSTPLPSDSTVEAAATAHAPNIQLANPCKNGPITSTTPPANTGWIYITEPDPPAAVESNPPPNAPGGELGIVATSSCSAVVPIGGNAELQITIKYHYWPLTPYIGQVMGSNLVFTAIDTVWTEY